MAKFKLQILAKETDPEVIKVAYAAETRKPKYIVSKRVGEFQTDYLLCVPYAGDMFDLPASQFLTLTIAHREDIDDLDPVNNPGLAEDARIGVVDGVVLEQTNVDDTISIYSVDGQWIKDMIAEAPVVEADGSHSNDGAHRAREGFTKPPTQIKPTGQAFNDSKLGVAEAEAAGFGNPLN